MKMLEWFLKRVLLRVALALGVVAYLIRRKFRSLIKERYDPIQLPALEDYVHESEKDLKFHILGGEAVEPWLMIKIWEERMGRPKYFKSRLFVSTIVHSTVKEDFCIASDKRKSYFYEPYRRFIGHDSILFQEGARHRRERAILNRGFGQQTYRAALPAMVRAADRLVERMEAGCTDHGSVECEPILSKLTMEVVADGAFSYDLNKDTKGTSTALRKMLRIGANPLCLLPGGPALVEWLERDTCAQIYSLLDDTISRRLVEEKSRNLPGRADSEDVESTLPQKKRGDLLDVILNCTRNAQDEFASERGPRWVRDQVHLLFVAGSDTTGSTLSWALPLLAHHQDIQTKIKQEIAASLSSGSGPENEFERYQSLTYVESFIKEVLRIYPPAGVARRLDDGEKEFRGVDLTCDPLAVLASNQFITHMREEYFPDPHRFLPDRWLTPGMADHDAFGTFSSGLRVCLGKGFAMLEMKVVIAKLLEKHSLFPLQTNQPLPFYGLVGNMHGPIGDYPLVYKRD